MLTEPSEIKKLSKTYFGYVKENKRVSNDTYQLTIESEIQRMHPKPGQFVSILCKPVLLRRPFSIANITLDSFDVIYKVKGPGTEYLSTLKKSQDIDFIGPLGNNFNITDENALLVGAGVGVAPLIFLSTILSAKKVNFSFLAAFKTYTDIKELSNPNIKIITEDSSGKLKGLITDYVEKEILENNVKKIYSCGPNIVLQKTTEIADKYGIITEVSMEDVFACGIGVCMGCVIKLNKDGNTVNKRICKDGPVFIGSEVLW